MRHGERATNTHPLTTSVPTTPPPFLGKKWLFFDHILPKNRRRPRSAGFLGKKWLLFNRLLPENGPTSAGP